MVYKIVRSDELYHHGILGQRWGTRNGPPYPLDASDHSASEKKAGWRKSLGGSSGNAISVKAAGHKAMSKVYSLNEKTYNKLGNKTLASMNAAEKNRQLKKAEDAQKEANIRASEKDKIKQRLKEVDPELAKNKQTRRVAYDYHNLSDRDFRRRYQASKETFRKRYVKSNGDTYSMGLAKAALAAKFVADHRGHIGMGEANARLEKKINNDLKVDYSTPEKARASVMKLLGQDILVSELTTRVGYKKAAEKYEVNKIANELYKKYGAEALAHLY